MTTTELIKSLRNHALPDPHDEREVLHAPLLREAADALEHMNDILMELTQEVQTGTDALGHYHRKCEQYKESAEGWKAQARQLREALVALEKLQRGDNTAPLSAEVFALVDKALAVNQNSSENTDTESDGCICKGNWRAIVKESEPLIGRTLVNAKGEQYRFFGLVHGEDDYYYGTIAEDGTLNNFSCVGDLESWGLTPMAIVED